MDQELCSLAMHCCHVNHFRVVQALLYSLFRCHTICYTVGTGAFRMDIHFKQVFFKVDIPPTQCATVLQAALVRKDEEMDQELRSLRQQHDQLTMQFKARRPLQYVHMS